MTGEVLKHGGHAAVPKPAREFRGEIADGVRIRVKRPVAYHLAQAPVEVQARRKTQVDVHGAQLRGDHPAGHPREAQRRLRVTVIFMPDPAHCRDRGETVPKPLYPATFMVHGDQERRAAQPTDLGDERGQLLRGLVVAGEQDDPTNRRFAQQITVCRRQRSAFDIEHDRSERHNNNSR
jgi:hypothetical protein